MHIERRASRSYRALTEVGPVQQGNDDVAPVFKNNHILSSVVNGEVTKGRHCSIALKQNSGVANVTSFIKMI